jgi:mono/diheme cytochrome c family protein
MNIKTIIFGMLMSTLILACSQGVDSPKGFSLPQGDVIKGEAAFRKHQCLACHNVEGYIDESTPKEIDASIQLGGTYSKVTTYAQLVTAIINPSHKISTQANELDNITYADGTSKMHVYNDVMTVSELTDIVTFLQPKYKVKPMHYTQYRNYYIH